MNGLPESALPENGPQHHALVCRAVVVAGAVLVVGMARAAESQRLGAVDGLGPRLEAHTRELVVYVDGDVDVDTAQVVDDRGEAVEVDLGIVGNRHAGEL